ncbi:MAG: esterase/lipase family protein, partial [Hydrogenophaga sp.]|uniref:esterase/lipase family protein n=1 Tax=Hydrogenophaga sp. TaxID=1904254 RepID=UPI004035F71C
GLHTSTNGREFARQLEVLVTQWPVPLASITLIGHSMGGLVARAACEEGRQADHRWRPLLRHLMFLGTPSAAGRPARRDSTVILS